MIPKFIKLDRELTPIESMYRRLFFSNQHYDGSDKLAFGRNSDLLKEIRESTELADDFKQMCEYLFYDQMSKFRDIHINNALGFHMNLEKLFDFIEDVPVPKRLT